jgi:hypothetical protein
VIQEESEDMAITVEKTKVAKDTLSMLKDDLAGEEGN